MDGFRDRMNRGGYDRGGYDRYDRNRRGSFSAASSISADEVMQIVDDSNAKQLDYINDFFADARDDKNESDKQILAAIESVKNVVANKESAVVTEDSPVGSVSEQILRTATSNNDLLTQFAEEQLPMLVRGNSSTLNQIRTEIAQNEDLLKEFLNAIRSDVAGVQAEIRKSNERVEDEDAPLDTEDVFTKAQADEMYKNMEENVHAECVKVYRNVQKVVEDQNATLVSEVKSSIGGVKGLTILNLVLLILNLAAVLLRIFDII